MVEEDKLKFEQLLFEIDRIFDCNGGKNHLRNFDYREMSICDIIARYYGMDVEHVSNEKHDAKDQAGRKWEFKTFTTKIATSKKYEGMLLMNGSFQLDKMDEDAKLPEVKLIDAWAFGVFKGTEYKPRFVILLDDRLIVRQFITAFVIPRQIEKSAKAKKEVAEGKRISRDTVNITVADLVSYFNNRLIILDSVAQRVSLESFLSKVKVNIKGNKLEYAA